MALIASALATAALLLLVVINLEGGPDEQARALPLDPSIDLITPETLRPGERPAPGPGYGQIAGVEAETGWIESVDPETGRLAQRHRFDRLDPDPEGLPEGWLRMVRPRAELYQGNGRVIRLSGDTALARAPHRVLEHGTLSGNVFIEMFEPEGEGPPDLERDEPAVTVRTEEARFDNKLGEVRCDGPVRIEAARGTMPGEGLTVQIDDLRDVYSLKLERVEYIRLRPPDAALRPPASVPAPEAARPASPPAGSPRAPARSADTETVAFYRLTLHDNVLLRQGVEDGERTVRGHDLSILFSEESEGFDGGLARTGPLSRPVPVLATLNGLAYATVQTASGPPAPEPGEILITCDGPLTIQPLPEGAERPRSAQDTLLLVTGAPVFMEDGPGGSRATCHELRYHLLDREVELIGTADTPLEVTAPEVYARADRFWMSRTRHRGGLVGTGELRLRDRRQETPRPDPLAELRIQWQEGVDLVFFDDDEEGTSLRTATFRGEVAVRHDEIHMDAASMVVGFGRDAAAEQTIESIDARGSVLVHAVGDSGAMRCEELDLALTRAPDGQTLPTRLQARGSVETEQDDQVMWSDDLDVTFTTVTRPDAPADGRATARVEKVHATGNVQILLADGSRAFGDELHADAEQETAVLQGEDVVVVHDKALFDHGHEVTLEIDRGRGAAHWRGSGQLRLFTEPIAIERRGRIERPRIDNGSTPPQVKAKWIEAMRFDNTVNDGAGAVDLEGQVEAITRLASTERNTMEGRSLRLEFALTPEERRVIRKLIAKGAAKLESRTWRTPERRDKPRVFYVAGAHVEYDDLKVEALVMGDGTLLVRDEGDPGAVTPAGDRPFSGRGITQFEFSERLHMTSTDRRYDFVLTGDVGVLHKALDGRTATLTGKRLEVTAEEPPPPAAGGEPEPEADGLAFGGRLDLRRIRALEGVYVTTPTRKVECDELDYDLVQGIARLTARPGRRVSVLTVDTDFPVTGGSMSWDLQTDRIRVTDPALTGGR